MIKILTAILLLIPALSIAEPAEVTGGRYYIWANGVLYVKDGKSYYNQPYTAFAIAENLSHECSCEVTIKTPDVKVRSKRGQLNNAEITWDTPTTRDDGSPLNQNEIANYVVARKVAETSERKVTVNGLLAGTHEFLLSTVDTDGVQGDWSSEIIVTIED